MEFYSEILRLRWWWETTASLCLKIRPVLRATTQTSWKLFGRHPTSISSTRGTTGRRKWFGELTEGDCWMLIGPGRGFLDRWLICRETLSTHFVPFYRIFCHFVLLSHFMSFFAILSHFMSFCDTFCHFISFFAILSHFMPLYRSLDLLAICFFLFYGLLGATVSCVCCPALVFVAIMNLCSQIPAWECVRRMVLR